MRRICFNFLLFCTFYCNQIIGQIEIDPDRLDQQVIDEASSINLSNEMNDESSAKIFKKGIALSEINSSVLQRISFLSQPDRNLILAYISKHQPLISKLEFQSIPGIDLDKIKQLIDLIVDNKTPEQYNSKWKDWNKLSGRLSLRWARQFPNDPLYSKPDSLSSTYQGSPDKLFLRFGIENNKFFSAGFVCEKDAGEKLWSKSSPTGVDYLSAFLQFEKINRRINSLILGDYRMRVGQGIILDNSYVSSTNIDLGLFAKSSQFLKPYHSLQENNMLRGAAINVELNPRNTSTIFYSQSRIDANLIQGDTSNTDSNIAFITSLQNSGYHRSLSEINDRNKLGVRTMGVNLKHQFNAAYIGLSVVNNYQDTKPVQAQEAYQVFAPLEQSQWYASVYHELNYRSALWYGEVASDQQSHFAMIQGILKGLGKYADVAIIYRNFSPGFSSRWSQVYSSNGKSQNEKGLLVGFNFFVNKECRFNLSWNTWQNPWLKYRVDLPSSAQEVSARFIYSRKRKWSTYIQFVYRQKEQNYPVSQVNELEQIANQNLRVHAELKLNTDWTWRARAEYHGFADPRIKEKGFMIYQDLLFKSIESRTSGNFRFCFFQTDSYNTRIYSFENDMLYQFRIPAYFGTGTLSYINLRTRLSNHWTAECRFSIQYNGFSKTQQTEINSYEKEIKFQVHYSFH